MKQVNLKQFMDEQQQKRLLFIQNLAYHRIKEMTRNANMMDRDIRDMLDIMQ